MLISSSAFYFSFSLAMIQAGQAMYHRSQWLEPGHTAYSILHTNLDFVPYDDYTVRCVHKMALVFSPVEILSFDEHISIATLLAWRSRNEGECLLRLIHMRRSLLFL